MDEREREQAGPTAEEMFVRQMKRRRAFLGLSQSELADRIVRLGGSMFQQTVAKIESGLRPLKLSEAEVIATALEVTFPQMLMDSLGEGEAMEGTLSWDELVSLATTMSEQAGAAEEDLQTARQQQRQDEQLAAMANAQLAASRAAVDRATAAWRHYTALNENYQNLLRANKKGTRFRKRRNRPGYIPVTSDEDE